MGAEWTSAEAWAAWTEVVLVGLGVAVTAGLGWVAWQTSKQATIASKRSAEVAEAALALESRREEESRVLQVRALLRVVHEEAAASSAEYSRLAWAIEKEDPHLVKAANTIVDGRRIQRAIVTVNDARVLVSDPTELRVLDVFRDALARCTGIPPREASDALTEVANEVISWRERVHSAEQVFEWASHFPHEVRKPETLEPE